MTEAETTVQPGDAEVPLILSVDVGTSSVRALVYDSRGRSVQGWEIHRPYTVTTTPDGGVVVDAASLVRLTEEAVDGVLRSIRTAGAGIGAVAFDTFWHGVMAIDARGSPLTPILTWADTRSAQAAEQLKKELNESEVHARTGTALHSSYLPAKLAWLRETDPDTFRSAARWVSFGEYFYHRLFGAFRVSISMASGTGFYDQNQCAWDGALLDTVGIRPDQLSDVADYTNAMQGLGSREAGRWPELAEVPWYLPIGDGAANNIGSGGSTDERVVVMVGTSGALRVVRRADRVDIPARLWTYRVDARRFVQGGALSAGGNVFAWAQRTLKVAAADRVEAEIAHMPPDSHGLTVLPFLAGERSPDWRTDAQSAIVGMTLDTRPSDILAALIESITYRFGLVYDIIRANVPAVRAIIGSGAGLVRSPLWTQMMSDVFGHSIVLSNVPEATSRGGALLALEALGAVPAAGALAEGLGSTYSPRAEYTRAYRAAMERQQRLYDTMLG